MTAAERETGAMRHLDREIILGCVLWGEKFRRYFADYCLASLVATGNLPALAGFAQRRFLIATTEADYLALSALPVFQEASRWVAFEHVPLPDPAAGSDGAHKMRLMSAGHGAIARIMFQAQAYGVYIYPDTVFSNRVMERLVAAAEAGDQAVLALCPRLANEGFLAALDAGQVRAGSSIEMEPRTLYALACAHMHSETLRYDWGARYFCNRPVMVFQRLRDGSGYIFHSTNWAPVLLDYATLAAHDDTALLERTIDADYIWANWGTSKRVRILQSTDEAGLISFTAESDLSYLPIRNDRILRVPLLADVYRRLTLRNFLFSGEIDPLKREQFVIPIDMPLRDRNEAAWDDARRRLSGAVAAIKSGPLGRLERALLTALVIANEGVILHLRFWVRNRKNRRANSRSAPGLGGPETERDDV